MEMNAKFVEPHPRRSSRPSLDFRRTGGIVRDAVNIGLRALQLRLFGA